MTDKEIEILFKSIDNFDEFHQNIVQRQDLKLQNNIEIKFNNGSSDHVELSLATKTLRLDTLTFTTIVNDLLRAKVSQDKQELSRVKKITEDRLRNEIFELVGNRYRVHDEYIEYMYFASDVASLHGTYQNRLQDLLRIFHRNNILIIGKKEISTREELIGFLKSYGFKYIDKDLTGNSV